VISRSITRDHVISRPITRDITRYHVISREIPLYHGISRDCDNLSVSAVNKSRTKIRFKDFYLNSIFWWDISGALLPNIFNFSKKTFLNLIFVLDLLKIQLKGQPKILKCQIKSCSKSIFR
jgi:hypothetical protein